MFDLVIKNVKHFETNQIINIAVKNGEISAIKEADTDLETLKEIDGQFDLILPPFVESHIHLDTVFTAGDPWWNESGTVMEGIKVWNERKKSLTYNDVKQRALKVLRLLIVQGVLHVRAHVDISDQNLTALKAILEIKEEMKDYIQLQIVAFPQDGIISCKRNVERLEEALKLGAYAIGAIPHYEYTREYGLKSLDICFSLAEKYNCMINVFCDEIDDSQSRFLDAVAAKTIESGLYERVTASHANALSLYDEAYVEKLLPIIQKAKLNIIACPLISSSSQGRSGGFPKNRGITRVKDLWNAGINVSIAHDDIMTPFYPLGNGNMLQAAHMAVHVCHMTGREEMEEVFNMITKRAAKTLQIEEGYGLQIGKPANFITLPVHDKFEAIRLQPTPRLVVSRGNIISSTPKNESKLYF
ncbi:cytosine deaminase [Cytobacillus dafuensis]|uniref:Cytosine deaminase n=1 Tax=Cytobacillus dafuensis TaxID=1742359 RepID=A0A5B8Z2J6_CYTDA|nr:cytosine deaminase [Cytobacillus dafuensis]QED47047.1 cytosine deaminase [Cytobacillus dafuensis]